MKKSKIFLYFLIIFLLTINIAFSEDRYVSTLGVDPISPASGCCADPGNPCRTISLAVSYSGAGNNVLVAKGIYTDEYINIAGINSEKIIQGGWDESFTEKSSDPSLTIIQGNDSEDYVFDIGGLAISNLVIDNFTITNPTVSGAGTYGFSLKSYSPYTINVTLKNLIVRESGSIGINLWSQKNGVVNAVIENCIIYNNDNGGIKCSASGAAPDYDQSVIDLDIINCTIADNSSYGVSLFACYNGQLTTNLKNSILWGQTTSALNILIIDDPSYSPVINASASYCDIESVSQQGGTYTEGVGMISQNPFFVNSLNGNYHIKSSSPCRVAGIYQKKVYAGGNWFFYNYSIPENDFEGDSRDSEWIENPADTYYKYCDMGADEFTNSGGLPWLPLLLLSD